MRIKKLEIVGFKSFCDRTVLHFNDPITGVVGPNGCGKSNVVDAIRWCMGEQSAKNIRGKAMEDVIFAGAEGRGAAGMCEVSMTFENDGRVPIEFIAYSEITVTRKLFRDGTSEYLLNNTPCRLRDVTDFFLGTGIGAKAYSIIEQGKVGLIVSSKPEDRRFLIEEAAGITKYKLKKKAAEKKMESTRQNLLRVSDVVAEIEKQLGSLRRQAQKAERYKQYKAEVRDIELWSASQRWLGIHAESRVATEELADRTQRREAAHTVVLAREAEIAASRLRSAEEERRLSAIQEKLYELDNRIKLGEAENEHEAREVADLDERGGAARVEIEQLGRQLADGSLEKDRLDVEVQAVEAARAGEVEALGERETRHRELKEMLGRVQRDLDAAKADGASAQADIARGEAQERSLGKSIEDLELRLGRVAEEGGRLDLRGNELRGEIARIDEALAQLRDEHRRQGEQRETHEARLAELKEVIAAAEPALKTVETDLGRKKSRHHSLEEIHNKYEGFARGTRAIMQRKSKDGIERWGIRGVVADVVEAPAEYEVAVEAALGERLGSIVVDSHEVGVDGIEFLKSQKQGRSSFVPLKARALVSVPAAPEGEPAADADGRSVGTSPVAETHSDPIVEPVENADGENTDLGVRGRILDLVRCDEEYRGVARALLGDTMVVDDLLQAVDLWRAGEKRRLVTLEGEVIEASGVVTGGSRDAQGAGVLQQKRELRELEEAIAALEIQFKAQSERLLTLKEERQEIDVTLEALRRERHRGDMGILTHEKDLHRLTEELTRLESRTGSLTRDHEDLARRRHETAHEAEEMRLVVRAARERLATAEENRESHGREAVRLIDLVDEASEELTVFKVRAAQVYEKRAALVGARARLEAQLKDAETRKQRLEKSITDGAERSQALSAQIEKRRAELVDQVARSRALGDELRAGRVAYEEKLGSLLQVESEIKRARVELTALAQEVGELELALRELALNRAHLEEQVEERWRVALIEQLVDHHLRPPISDAEEKRLRELRDLIDRMGEINLTAIDEYKALEERYNFLCSQRSDLETALGQLEEAITQINKASKKRFREVFDLVNHKFQELFPRLFRGGHARLTLTNDEDVLESGIEIVAQPPGKKNTTIELLSGGEKALTAVSLIFAIFLVKPSPFCLLDEVDAPLDEANVGRFNDLVRAMTDRSQFIIITHNKRTMEIVDTLYGVTMEQPGCSKLVSVNLTTATTGKKAA